MQRTLTILIALLLASSSASLAADELVVYPPVLGLAPSEHCTVRVRSAGDGQTVAQDTGNSTATNRQSVEYRHLP